MKLQELMDKTGLGTTAHQVKAFFLGALTAERPLSFSKAMDELLAEEPDTKVILEPELKKLWQNLEMNKTTELANMFPQEASPAEQIDYFLTAMSLAGTNAETCKDEDLADFIEALEELLEDFDDADTADTEAELKETLMDIWEEFLATK